MSKNYIEINKKLWNARTAIHYDSEFYDNNAFIAGKCSLNSIELNLLGDVSDKSILHLQCHFGQDSISLSRLGAKKVVGVDLSNHAIDKAKELAKTTNQNTSFICCDIYDLPNHLNEKFDIVFSSYGVIGWLPDLEKWAQLIQQFLKPNGNFVFAEFHPVVWMFDDSFKNIEYSYFNQGPIEDSEEGTYANKDANISNDFIVWNHSLEDVINNLLKNNLQLQSFEEFNYSPYNCFNNTTRVDERNYRIAHLNEKIPMVYALKAFKNKNS